MSFRFDVAGRTFHRKLGWLQGLVACGGLLLAGLCSPAMAASPETRPGNETKPVSAEFPGELVRFKPYSGNPVLTAAEKGAWDSQIRERGWVLRDGNAWRLWYTGYDGTPTGQRKLGLATSADGLKWTRSPDNPLFDQIWVEDMQVLRDGNAYQMFAEGPNNSSCRLTSPDGIHWQQVGALDIRLKNGKPIPPGPYGTPTVWQEQGKWYLFYERFDAGVWLATSTDRKVWTNLQDEPVLNRGPEPYDNVMIALNQIIKHRGRYYAYYHGSATPEKPRLWCTCVAVSSDLIHWKKYAGNPLLPMADNRSSGMVVPDGDRFRLYTMHDRVDVYFSERANSERE